MNNCTKWINKHEKVNFHVCLFSYLSTHPFNKHVLGAYYEQGAILKTGNIANTHNIAEVLVSMKFTLKLVVRRQKVNIWVNWEIVISVMEKGKAENGVRNCGHKKL